MSKRNFFVKNTLACSVLSTVVIFSLIGAALAYTTLLSYKSTAFSAFSVTLPEFKVMSERIQSVQSFDTYASHVEQGKNEKSVRARLDRLRSTVIGGESKWLEPVLRISKLDAKELVGEASRAGEGSAMIGYRISTKAHSPEEAQKQTALLADYVIDSNLRELILARFDQAVIKHKMLANATAAEQALQTYNVSMLEKRLEQLKRISEAYPTLNKPEARQVISIEKGGDRYMPLPSQMAAVETEILDIKESIARSTRKLLQSRAEGEMLLAQGKIIQASSSGRELITALIADTEARLPKAVEDYDKLTFLAYSNDYADVKARHLDLPRFIVAPEYSEKPLVSPLKVILVFAVLGLLLALAHKFRHQLWAVMRGEGSHPLKIQQ